MELSWIRTFVTIAEKGSFRKAADTLYVSQPTVTVHIKLLEKEIGVQLFQRTNRTIKLTEEGRHYLNHANKLLAVHQQGIEEMRSFSQGYSRKLRLAISPSIADTAMPFILKSYLKKNTEVEISVDIMDSVYIEEAVSQEKVDIGFSLLKSNDASLYCRQLYEDQLVFCVPHDGFDLESAPAHDPEEIFRNHHLLTHNYPGYWDALSVQLKLIYPRVKMMKVSQIHITKRFIIHGLGVSFLPKSTIHRELLEGRIIEADIPEINLPQVNTYALTKYNHNLENDFLEFVSMHRFG
ncbi:LysR family transcriptional regulator [Sediminibacillus massiliensis]|uniref:LysR family transcriptional regulator n=1 Tax=Sediminibacillus massiliensis TaxID=1926277 RepID=UPI00098865C5|nr:LysR family transcriptional regulator [Sediminibacillus massiliensis]